MTKKKDPITLADLFMEIAIVLRSLEQGPNVKLSRAVANEILSRLDALKYAEQEDTINRVLAKASQAFSKKKRKVKKSKKKDTFDRKYAQMRKDLGLPAKSILFND
jgi:hypothetical protein